MYIVWICFFLSSFQLSTSIGLSASDSLRLVQLIHRHGDKNPERTYPNDPYKDLSNWPGGWEQLTDKGKKQLYDLGIYLRERYDGFISKEYSSQEIYIVSSETDRSIRSALANAAGFYRDSNLEANWTSDLRWNPIPVHVIQKEYDRILHHTEDCPRMTEIEEDVLFHSNFSQQFITENKELLAYISEYAGINGTNLFLTMHLAMTLQNEKGKNLVLPNWTQPLMTTEAFTTTFMKMIKLISSYEDWNRLRTGPMYDLLIQNMDARIGNGSQNMKSENLKMLMYSAHDRTILDMMSSFNLYDGEDNVPYGSCLIIELHENNSNSGEFYLEMFYRNDTSRDPYKLTIADCGSPCLLEKFKQLVKPLIPQDYVKECQPKKSKASSTISSDFSTGLMYAGYFTIIVLFIGCTIFAFYGRGNGHADYVQH